MNFARWCRNEWERTVAVLSIGAGLVVFFLGWLGQRDKPLVTEQVPYVVSGAMFGLLLIVLGTTIWLSADMRDEWIKLDRLEENVARAVTLLDSQAERDLRVAAPTHRAPVEAQR
jgi:hypothetical protein